VVWERALRYHAGMQAFIPSSRRVSDTQMSTGKRTSRKRRLRALVLSILLGLVLTPDPAEAQEPGKDGGGAAGSRALREVTRQDTAQEQRHTAAESRAPREVFPPWALPAKRMAVASDSPYASQAGLEILQAGGNAIDAAAAVSFALGVTRPYSTGLGGGGFLIARFADGRTVVLDYRETAPAASTPDMFVKRRQEDSGGPEPSRYGGLAVGVPGTLSGWQYALPKWGTKSLAEVIEPARRLAAMGYRVDEHFVKTTGSIRKKYRRYPPLGHLGAFVYHKYLAGGKKWRVGEVVRHPELAKLLKTLQEHGADAFYRGPVAEDLVRAVREHGGIITKEDLAGYRPSSREPLLGTYRGYELLVMPPPSSGGTTILEALNILSHFELATVRTEDPAAAIHLQLEAYKHAFADRARWLGDTDFVDVPVARLVSPEYGASLAERIIPLRTEPNLSRYGSQPEGERYPHAQLEDAGTSHFCVIDRWGNVVVATETINTEFGSLVAVPEWGLILNNEMDDFAALPGEANAFGLIQSARNAPEPGKRPLSSMSPTIVLKDGKPMLLLGASGGPRIITSVLDVMINVLDYGMDLPEAVEALRPHHQWQPDNVYFDAEIPAVLREALETRGHTVAQKYRTGIVQAIYCSPDGSLIAVSDPRKGGRPAGE
jgi:gamma-glutamyltranspeptidase/glutathione hydrolase